MALGNWKVEVNTNGMPQKVATAIGKLAETLMGAEYEPIAYLGSQVVNGVNHAVLAEQTIVTGRDSRNVVLLIFNEKPNEMEASLVSIERVVEGGGYLGGTNIDVKTELPAEAVDVWTKAFEGFVGSNVTPVALLGTQVVNGINYIFIAEVVPVIPNADKEIALITINSTTKEVSFADILENKHNASLGYAFTWLKNCVNFAD